MEPDLGKVFIGGISWDTDENGLKEYFSAHGEVVEAVIMKDRSTGRGRGFGFVVFAEPAVAERVVMEKHMIDGRAVEAKKAVPRTEHSVNRRDNSIQGSPGPGRTKKIFVGGLASTVTERDFKLYFDQFGTITDVVIMYDQNTQRPRGFGFITYDSEEAVDRVLYKTFHVLNGKMVEVKRAVPKELSPAPNRSPLLGFNSNFSRANSLLDSYAQRYNMSSFGGYGVGMDGRFNPVVSGRNGFSPLSSPSYGMGVNMDPVLSPGFGGSSNFNNNLGYGQLLSPYYDGNLNRYNTSIGYGTSNGRNGYLVSPSARDMWRNCGLTNVAHSASTGAYLGSGNGSFGVPRSNGASGISPFAAQGGRIPSGHANGTTGYVAGENNYELGGGLGKHGGTSISRTSSLVASYGAYEGSYGDLYSSGSAFSDPTWPSTSSELDGSASFGYGLSNAPDVAAKRSEDIGGYSTAIRQSDRGIVA